MLTPFPHRVPKIQEQHRAEHLKNPAAARRTVPETVRDWEAPGEVGGLGGLGYRVSKNLLFQGLDPII